MKKNIGYESKNRSRQELVLALDIGTSKIAVVIGKAYDSGKLKIVSMASCPSLGMRNGSVIDIAKVVGSIRQAVNEAQAASGCKKIRKAVISIADERMQSFTSDGVVIVMDKQVSRHDVERVHELARNNARVSPNNHILHALPHGYSIDDTRNVTQPVGMSGVRLEACLHLVTCSHNALSDMKDCVKQAGPTVSNVVLQSLASAEAVLLEDHKKLGVCLVDIGSGTTDIAIFIDDHVYHAGVIVTGGRNVTDDIAQAFSISIKSAEKLKKNHGTMLLKHIRNDEFINVLGLEGEKRTVSRYILAQVIEIRYRQILDVIRDDLERKGLLSCLGAGFVFTGGGSMINGLASMTRSFFNLPTSIGCCSRVEGSRDVLENPVYATCLGLLLWDRNTGLKDKKAGNDKSFQHGLVQRVLNWCGI